MAFSSRTIYSVLNLTTVQESPLSEANNWNKRHFSIFQQNNINSRLYSIKNVAQQKLMEKIGRNSSKKCSLYKPLDLNSFNKMHTFGCYDKIFVAVLNLKKIYTEKSPPLNISREQRYLFLSSQWYEIYETCLQKLRTFALFLTAQQYSKLSAA